MRIIALAVLALLASILPAQSESLPWEPVTITQQPRTFQTGVYLGINGGYQVGATELDLNGPGGSIVNLDGLSSRGTVYGVHGGFDFRIAGTPWLVGLVGSYQFGEADFNVALGGTNVLSSTIEPTWKAGARAGYVFGNGTLAYVGYQFAKAEMSVSSPLFTTISRDLDGKNILAGIEIPVTDFVTVGIQYDRTTYDTSTLASFGPFKLDADTDVHAITARVNIRLQGMFGN